MEKQECNVSPKISSPISPSPDAIQQHLPIQPPVPQKSDYSSSAIKIFMVCSRDTEDRTLRDKLIQGLRPLCRTNEIIIWHEDMVLPGSEHQREVMFHLEQSALILLLLSQSFFDSDDCYNIQQKVMEKQNRKEVLAIPIILRPCDWEETLDSIDVLPTNRNPMTAWSNLDDAFLDVTKGIRRVINTPISTIAGSTPISNTQSINQSNGLPSQWNVRYRRNPFFTGRESVLTNLHKILHSQKMATLTQALTGLGGIGKTQTAVEYAYLYQQEYTAVLWVRADSREALTADFVTIADILDLSPKSEQDQQRIVQGVRDWFNTHTNWLLIFDDVEDIDILCDFLPQSDAGHIILTTRSQSLGTVANTIEIEKMQVDEAVLFLLRRAKMIGLDDPCDAAPQGEQENAREIAELLDGLPLALDQAGAYVEETRCSLARYLELYKRRRSELLKKRGRITSGHPESVTTTFLLCFEKVSQINSVSTELLRCCALLHPDDIPEELFTEGAIELGPILKPLATNPLILDEAIAELFQYSLIQRNVNTNMVSIHHLVQAVLLDEMDEQVQHTWAERVVKAIMKVFPDRHSKTWQYLQRYFTHAQVCAALIKRWNMQDGAIVRWLFQVGKYVSSSGLYTMAEQFHIQGNTLLKKDLSDKVEIILGAEAADYVRNSPAMETLTSISPLPFLYFQQGKYEQAEAQLQHAIAFIEQTRGPEHESIIGHLHALGALYSTTGKYANAEKLFQRALNIHLRSSSADANELAACLNNLAELYRKQEKYEQAGPLYEQALYIREVQFGTDNIEVAQILHNMALLCRAQEKYSQAEALYQRALPIYEHTHGPESPLLANVLNSLGVLYAYQDEEAKAEPLFLRALAIREKILGHEHTDVGRTLNNLGNLYIRQGKYDEAHVALQRSLQIYKSSFGEEHPEVAMALTNLGHLYFILHKYAQAETALEKALMIQEKTVGLQSPNTIAIFQELVTVYAAQKKSLPIQMLCQRVLPALKGRLGAYHKDVQIVQNLLIGLSQKSWNQTDTRGRFPKSSSRSKNNKKRRKRNK